VIDSFWLLLIVIILVDLAVAAVRASLFSARATHLVMLRDQRPVAADRTLALLSRPRLRISLRLALVLMHLLFAVLVWILFDRWLSAANAGQAVVAAPDQPLLGFAMLILAGSLLMVVEYSIEGRILQNPEMWAMTLGPLGALLDFVFTPLAALLLALLGYTAQQNVTPEMTEDDLKTWVEAGQKEGTLEKEERKMIYSIFHFGETLAREIMVPRIDILALDANTTLEDAIDAFSRSGHSRVPVYEDSIDNIIGLLYAKDLLAVRRGTSEPIAAMREYLRPAYFVPEAKKVDDLLTEMQSSRVHMAVVVDEYGGVAGLVTLEDIMEEIIGEIQDEYDQAEESLYQQIGPDEFVFHGRIDLNDFNEIMGTHLEKEAMDTLGGYIYGEIGRIPTGGEAIEADGLVLTVEQVSARRIRKVRARKLQSTQEMEVEQSDNDRRPTT